MGLEHDAAGWLLTGFQAMTALSIWVGSVLIYGIARSILQPEPDPIRGSGPID